MTYIYHLIFFKNSYKINLPCINKDILKIHS